MRRLQTQRGKVFSDVVDVGGDAGAEAGDVARRYHGYYFAWATIYTFWYHPMVFTQGHAIGFLYMFLLLTQGALMFTRMHVNRWWTVTLEGLVVLPEGARAALERGIAGELDG